MSYTQHTWTNNQLITASKLNNIEQGITEAAQSGGSGPNIIIATYTSDGYLDKTLDEVIAADLCFIHYVNQNTLYTYLVFNVAPPSVYVINLKMIANNANNPVAQFQTGWDGTNRLYLTSGNM